MGLGTLELPLDAGFAQPGREAHAILSSGVRNMTAVIPFDRCGAQGCARLRCLGDGRLGEVDHVPVAPPSASGDSRILDFEHLALHQAPTAYP
jgi:hypothetical protein